jgi:hypothetical protein
MQFDLPENLKMAVAAYDPVLKAIAKQNAQQAKPGRKTYSLGLPSDLVPHGLMSASLQIETAKNINDIPANDRAVTLELNEGKVIICIIHHKNIWLSAWVDHRQSDYLYGFCYQYKAANSVASKVDRIVVSRVYDKRLDLVNKETSVKHGRTEFRRFSMFVTRDDVMEYDAVLPWDSFVPPYHSSSYSKSRALKSLTDKGIRPLIPTFDNEHIFSRVKALRDPFTFTFKESTYSELTPETICAKLDVPDRVCNTPFFRNKISVAITAFNSCLQDSQIRRSFDARSSIEDVRHRIEWVKVFLEIYPNAELDYVQQIYNECNHVKVPWGLTRPGIPKWLLENMPITSFIKIVSTFNTEANLKWGSSERGPISFTMLEDTLSMLYNILHHNTINTGSGVTIMRPSRWRINNFHDYLLEINFKIKHKDEALPQHLFPQPVKVLNSNGRKWTFFQPNSVHQLASWGSAVRNCVGSATTYREGIKRKSHFIILAMIDNKPEFTVQASVNNGKLTISQIAGINNRALRDTERDEYQSAFAEAINQLNASLSEGTS